MVSWKQAAFDTQTTDEIGPTGRTYYLCTKENIQVAEICRWAKIIHLRMSISPMALPKLRSSQWHVTAMAEDLHANRIRYHALIRRHVITPSDTMWAPLT